MRSATFLLIAFTMVSQVTCANMSTGPSPAGPLTVSALAPASGPIGTEVVITGSNFSTARNHVKFGVGYITNLASPDGTTVRFVVPQTLNVCPPDSTDPCPTIVPRVLSGSYPVAVMAGGETSNSLTFTVTDR